MEANEKVNKIKVLAWGDSAIAGTGFGVVARHVLQCIHSTGRYEIHQLAINHHGDFTDDKEIPWQMQPARLLDPKDPHGMKMFLRTVAKSDYDIIWILNDVYVLNEITAEFNKVIQEKRAQKKKVPVVVYYYPVDCHVPLDGSSFMPLADILVCYTDHGKAETLKSWPQLANKIAQIPHGVDSHIYHPLDPVKVKEFKNKLLRTTDDTYLVLNVNRNSTRKQIQYSILAFKEFKKKVPNAVMYVHAASMDQGGDLRRAVIDLGLNPTKDVIFPINFSPANPVSPATLNMIYNMADMFLTTHLGEGWGLTITEAMAAGTPVVAPNNTCMPQQLGVNSERGYMYPCNDMIWIDPSGYRPKGLIPDIVEQMIEVYRAGTKATNPKVQAAMRWAQAHDWKHLHSSWTDIFNKADEIRVEKNTSHNTTGEII
jgi:glycosyltransferase involved in cell wall biosynthesis